VCVYSLPGQSTIIGRMNVNRFGVPSQLLTFISHQHVQLDVRDDNTVFVTALASMQDQNHLIRIGDHILRKGVRSSLRIGDQLTLLVRAVYMPIESKCIISATHVSTVTSAVISVQKIFQ